MTDTPRYVTLRDYLQVLRSHRVLIVLVTLLFGGVAYVVSSQQAPMYQAEAALSFSDPGQDLELLGTPVSPQQAPAERAAIGADKIERNVVLRRVARETGIRDTEALRDLVTARPEARTNLVVIQAETGDARRAAQVANSFARAVRDYVTDEEHRRYDRIADGLRREYREVGDEVDGGSRALFADRVARVEALKDFARPAEIAKTAGVPESPSSPQTVRNTILGLVAGLLIALCVAFGRDALDRRLRRTADVRQELGVPLLGQLGKGALGASPIAVNGHRVLSDVDGEAIRILRTNLEFLAPESELRVVLVSSATAEEGKSTTSSALAVSAARSGQDVLLLECDMRKPSMADRLGLKARPGLSDVLTGEAQVPEVAQDVEVPGPGRLTCITAGSKVDAPSDLLRSVRLRELLAGARRQYDLVVLDGTPLLYVVDARELLPHADGLLLCVRTAHATQDDVRAAKDALARLPERPTGLIVTGVKPRDEVGSGYYAAAGRR